MNNKNFSLVVGVIFSIITVLHLFRIVLGWEAVIGGLMLPILVSWLAVAAACYLAISAFSLWKKN